MNRRDALQLLSKAGMGLATTPGLLKKLSVLHRDTTDTIDVPEEVQLIADMILPRTDTPGALDAGAPEFVMYMLTEISPIEQADKFNAGLKAFREECISRYGGTFGTLSDEDRESTLRRLIETENAFVSQLHGLILISYFTSQQGMTEALTYNPVPMQYEPCVDVTPETRGEASYF